MAGAGCCGRGELGAWCCPTIRALRRSERWSVRRSSTATPSTHGRRDGRRLARHLWRALAVWNRAQDIKTMRQSLKRCWPSARRSLPCRSKVVSIWPAIGPAVGSSTCTEVGTMVSKIHTGSIVTNEDGGLDAALHGEQPATTDRHGNCGTDRCPLERPTVDDHLNETIPSEPPAAIRLRPEDSKSKPQPAPAAGPIPQPVPVRLKSSTSRYVARKRSDMKTAPLSRKGDGTSRGFGRVPHPGGSGWRPAGDGGAQGDRMD